MRRETMFVVIIGASIKAGLLAAACLSDAGHHVLLAVPEINPPEIAIEYLKDRNLAYADRADSAQPADATPKPAPAELSPAAGLASEPYMWPWDRRWGHTGRLAAAPSLSTGVGKEPRS
jgi:hypothetical protein